MPSVSYSVEMSVDDRLLKYIEETNKTRKGNTITLNSRTDGIDSLLNKAGF